jgi:hypothetical protein
MPETPNATPSTASLLIAGKLPMGVRLPKPQVALPEPQAPSSEAQTPLPEVPVPLPAKAAAQPALSETIEGYIVAHHYAALTNWFCQLHLASLEQVADDDAVKTILDASYQDFLRLEGRLAALDPQELQAHPQAPLYQQTRDAWRDCIKDWAALSKEKTADRLAGQVCSS